MRRIPRTALLVAAAVSLAAACDDGDGDSGTDTDTVVDGPGVPFDGDVEPGVQTSTNETENQGFEGDEAPDGGVGNGLPAPPSD